MSRRKNPEFTVSYTALLGRCVAALRVEANSSQLLFATMCGLGEGTLARIESEAQRMASLVDGPPTFHDLDGVDDRSY